jgi:hypothetical protein
MASALQHFAVNRAGYLLHGWLTQPDLCQLKHFRIIRRGGSYMSRTQAPRERCV